MDRDKPKTNVMGFFENKTTTAFQSANFVASDFAAVRVKPTKASKADKQAKRNNNANNIISELDKQKAAIFLTEEQRTKQKRQKAARKAASKHKSKQFLKSISTK